MVALFERLGDAIDTPKEPEILRAIYERMPRLNFSRDLLAHVPGDTAVMQMQGVWWSDWGSPDRIVQTLTRLGAGPALIAEQLRAAVAERWSGAPLPHGEAMRRQFD
jgi:mannose-1-phosphate guanylyltransferase